jgi:hypothetical protein
MSPACDLVRAEIQEVLNIDNIACAGPADFRLASACRIGVREAMAEHVLPYCLDPANRLSLYVGGLEPDEIRGAPLSYLHARRRARSVYFVPWRNGALYPACEAPAPTFLFSSGRCGTTLMCRILYESGIAAVSEPDFYTQFTAALLTDIETRFRGQDIRAAIGAMTADLSRVLAGTSGLVVKLRAEVCLAVRSLLPLFAGERKTIFMYRAFEPWARSTLHFFPLTPQQVVAKYTVGLKCLSILRQISACHIVRYETLVSDPLSECRRLGRFLDRTFPSEAIARAMVGDSQVDTPLAREKSATPANFDDNLAGAIELWNTPRWDGLRAQMPK